MILRPPRSTRTDTLFPYRRSSDLEKYNERVASRMFELMPKAVNAKMLERSRQPGCESELPVFILGMPRSGTSLMEQILSSHPDVFGAGELKRSEEHTSELQSLMRISYAVFCLKKKKKAITTQNM